MRPPRNGVRGASGLNSAFLARSVLESLGFAKLGEDVLIRSTVVIVDCHKISLGSRVRIDPFVIISNRGGVVFGDNIHIGSHSILAGSEAIRFEDFANISHYVGIYTSQEDASGRTLSNPTVKWSRAGARTKPIHFGRHATVGSGSVILPGARFDEGSLVGGLSMVSRPLAPWTTYFGIPARKIGEHSRDALRHEQEYHAWLKENA